MLYLIWLFRSPVSWQAGSGPSCVAPKKPTTQVGMPTAGGGAEHRAFSLLGIVLSVTPWTGCDLPQGCGLARCGVPGNRSEVRRETKAASCFQHTPGLSQTR